MKIKPKIIVTLKKGSVIKSYNPLKKQYILNRRQKVSIDHCIGDDIVWSGSGKYWYWTSKGNIEVVK